MKRNLTVVIVLLMALSTISAQQYLYLWKADGSHVSYLVTDIDSIGFYAPFYIVNLTAEGKGTVSGSGEYGKGETVTLVATANKGYTFTQWSDGNTDNPRTVLLNDNLTLTATFSLAASAFSVSPTTKVMFSPGNLQYHANLGSHLCADGTTQNGTWRFAEHQWDMVGYGYGQGGAAYDNIIGGTIEGSSNNGSTKAWKDLFCWGTSGWKSGANASFPEAVSEYYYDYYIGGNPNYDFSGYYAYADWGVYNQIGDDAPGTWRTMTKDEWEYLFQERPNALNKYGAARVNGITGVVILPDDWTLPNGCSFTAGMTNANDYKDWGQVNNVYVGTQWELMESNGAIFLPASGFRSGNSANTSNIIAQRVGAAGYYWSSTVYNESSVYGLSFSSKALYSQAHLSRGYGRAVRLVVNL